MYCAKCGHKNPDDSLFCSACGQRVVGIPIQTEHNTTAPVSRPAVPVTKMQPTAPTPRTDANRMPAPRKKKGGGGLIVIIIILIVMIIALIGLVIYFLLDHNGSSSREKEEGRSYSVSEQLYSPLSTGEEGSSAQNDTQIDTTVEVTEEIESTQIPTESEVKTESTTEPAEEETEQISTQPAYESSSYYSWLDEDGYFLADSDRRYLTESDLYWMSTEQIQYAINEIYARHGRIFQTEFLQAHFESLPWYYGTTTAEEFSDAVFNVYEKANIDLLSRLKNEA